MVRRDASSANGLWKLLVLVLLGVLFPLPVSAATAPPKTHSVYVSSQNMYDLGANLPNIAGAYILNFGAPAYAPNYYPGGAGAFGAFDYSKSFRSWSTLYSNVNAFINGYTANTAHTAQIAVLAATTNFDLGTLAPTDLGYGYRLAQGDWAMHGTQWHDDLVALLSGNSLVSVAAANDMEISWSSPTLTKPWIDAYNTANSPTYRRLYDYGDVQSALSTENGWTTDLKWFKSYGCTACWPFPQIYYQANADQWAALSNWALTNKGAKIVFKGVLSQDGKGTGTTTSDGNLSATDSYNALVTATGQPSIDYLSWMW